MHFVELEFLRRNDQMEENSEYFQVSLTSCAGTTRYARRELFCPKLQHFLSFKYIEMQPRRSKWQVYCFLIISIQWCHTDEFKRKRKRGIIEYGFSHSLWSAQGTSCQRKGLKFLVSFFFFFLSRNRSNFSSFKRTLVDRLNPFVRTWTFKRKKSLAKGRNYYTNKLFIPQQVHVKEVSFYNQMKTEIVKQEIRTSSARVSTINFLERNFLPAGRS